MVQIELSEEEQRVLQKVLGSYLRDLRVEITHTDARDVRDELKEEEATLKELLGRLVEATKVTG